MCSVFKWTIIVLKCKFGYTETSDHMENDNYIFNDDRIIEIDTQSAMALDICGIFMDILAIL